MAIKKVAIIGVGLIGGSLGMALKDLGHVAKVVGVSRNEKHLKTAVEKKAIDEGTTDPATAVLDADLVVITTPIQTIIPTLKKIVPYLKKGAIVTDVGSTKEQIVLDAEKIMPEGCFFIGSHPMAGSERSGIEAAHTFLFDNAVWIFTPTANTDLKALDKLRIFLKKLDVRPLVLRPEIHDKVVAAISHLPYLAACSVVSVLAEEKEYKKEMLELASSGFRDTTRVASSLTEWGLSICQTNKTAMLEVLDKMIRSLQETKKMVQMDRQDELLKYFEKIKKFREGMF
ncbi:MAG: prephenate dehydrogenase [Candidatus Margulisiibacteriota bacterium]|jgi:prephenate dehydrogenase